MRMVCSEDRIEAELARGNHARLVGELEKLVDRYPLRERLRGQLMLALCRSGRHAALSAYQMARDALVGQLGIGLLEVAVPLTAGGDELVLAPTGVLSHSQAGRAVARFLNCIPYPRRVRRRSKFVFRRASLDFRSPIRAGLPLATWIVAEGFHGVLKIGRGSIYVINRDGTDLTNITTGVVAVDPAWSPPGDKIAYRVEHVHAEDDLFTIDPDGRHNSHLS